MNDAFTETDRETPRERERERRRQRDSTGISQLLSQAAQSPDPGPCFHLLGHGCGLVCFELQDLRARPCFLEVQGWGSSRIEFWFFTAYLIKGRVAGLVIRAFYTRSTVGPVWLIGALGLCARQARDNSKRFLHPRLLHTCW